MASCGIHARLHSAICQCIILYVTGAVSARDSSCLRNMASSFARFPFDTLKSLPALQSMHMVKFVCKLGFDFLLF